ncbi:MAG TPA: acyl carrier protein, partial [Streptosporangiaceae bacterium]|nr:acyl carrier protein [Streptosporangiaceae bacterium]
FTITELGRILEASSGAADGVDWASAATLDVPFEELGYDSLALLELCARVQQEYEVQIPDDAVSEMRTPRSAVGYVNERFSTKGVS